MFVADNFEESEAVLPIKSKLTLVDYKYNNVTMKEELTYELK